VAESVFRVAGLIEVRLPELKSTRNARGQFTKAQTEMRSRNGRYVRELQADVVRQVQSRITRQGASTGRLAAVTASPKNAEYDTWSIGVGVKSYLDSSIAKYWRTFEEGSAAVWRHPFIGTQLMPKGGTPPYPVAHGAVPGIRTTQAHLRWMDGKKFVVKKEIAPREAYAAALREAQPALWGRRNIQKFLADVIGDHDVAAP